MRKIIDMSPEEMAKYKEAGMSDSELAKLISELEGKDIKSNTVSKRLIKYYKSIGKEKPRADRLPMVDNDTIEEKEPDVTVNLCQSKKEYDDAIKHILMNGMSIDEYISEKKKARGEIELTFRKLEFICQHLDKKDGQWIQDNNFETLLVSVENDITVTTMKKELETLLKNRQYTRKTLKDRIEQYFDGNIDLAVYILTRLNPLCKKSDVKDFEILRTQYEHKIDEYLEKLHTLEENIKSNKEEPTQKGKRDDEEK